jgi:protein AATF/BFR2
VLYVKALWDKILEFRFLLQKAFDRSNRLPQEPVKSLFCSEDEDVSTAYTDLVTSSKKTLDSLLELQEALFEKNPSVDQQVNATASEESNKSDAEDSDEWQRISDLQKRMSVFRNKAVDKWQRKTQVTTGAAAIKGKLHAFNQNVSEQVASYMRDPSRMIKQMQQSRSTVAVFGTVSFCFDNKSINHLRIWPLVVNRSASLQFFLTLNLNIHRSLRKPWNQIQRKNKKKETLNLWKMLSSIGSY